MEYRFCPKCGTELVETGSQRMRCPSCPFHHFPKVATCVVAVVYDQDRVLLDKRAHEPGKGLWALPGGYLEPKESPEEGVERELAEETGLQVKVEKLLSIINGTKTCTLFYLARTSGGRLDPSSESLDVNWFRSSSIPWAEIAFSMHRSVLQGWAGVEAL